MKDNKPHFNNKPGFKKPFKQPFKQHNNQHAKKTSKPLQEVNRHKMQSSDHFSTKGSVGIILNRTTNSFEEKTRHTNDFYINQEARWIENAITKKTQKLMGVE